MTGKVIDSGATSFLVLIIPIALIAVVVATAWPILLALLLIIIIWQIIQQWQWQRFINKVNPIFNQLLKDNNGCVTPVDLAMKANVEGNQANKFLDYKATEFSAKSREIPNQGKVYYFLTSSAVENFFTEPDSLDNLELEEENDLAESSEEITTSSVAKASNLSQVNSNVNRATATQTEVTSTSPTANTEEDNQVSLIQAELARRLMVHPSTVGKRKLDPDFSQWSRKRDPEKISWHYSDETKLFYPLDE